MVSMLLFHLILLLILCNNVMYNLCKILLLLAFQFTPRLARSLRKHLQTWRDMQMRTGGTSTSQLGTWCGWRLITFASRLHCPASWLHVGLAPTRWHKSSTQLLCDLPFPPPYRFILSSMWASWNTMPAIRCKQSRQSLIMAMVTKSLRLRWSWSIVLLGETYSFWLNGKIILILRTHGNRNPVLGMQSVFLGHTKGVMGYDDDLYFLLVCKFSCGTCTPDQQKSKVTAPLFSLRRAENPSTKSIG